jgi:hypothetical protein
MHSVDEELRKEQESKERSNDRLEKELDTAYSEAEKVADFEISERSFALGYWAAVRNRSL